MGFLRFLVAATAFLFCLVLGAGGGCLVGWFGLNDGSDYGPMVVSLITGLIGAAVGLVLGFLMAVQVYRSLERRDS